MEWDFFLKPVLNIFREFISALPSCLVSRKSWNKHNLRITVLRPLSDFSPKDFLRFNMRPNYLMWWLFSQWSSLSVLHLAASAQSHASKWITFPKKTVLCSPSVPFFFSFLFLLRAEVHQIRRHRVQYGVMVQWVVMVHRVCTAGYRDGAGSWRGREAVQGL